MGIALALAALVIAVTAAGRSRAAAPPGVPSVPGPGGAPPGAIPGAAQTCASTAGIGGATDRGTYKDQNNVTWCLYTIPQPSQAPSILPSEGVSYVGDVWHAYTSGYGAPERKIAQPARDLLIAGIQAFALVSKPSGGVSSGMPSTVVPSTDSSPTCGTYPPIVNGWRPVCTSQRLAEGTSVPPSSRVEITIQEGARALDDQTNMMVVEGVVTSGTALTGYDVAFMGLVKKSNTSVATPLFGTVFRAVRPSFINRIVPPDEVTPGVAPTVPSGSFPGGFPTDLSGVPGGIPGGFPIPTGTMVTPGTDPTPPLPPTVPGTPTLPPLPVVNTLGLSPGIQHGITILPMADGGNAAYVWSRGSAGPKAPSGLDIVMYAAGERAIFAIRSADTSTWAFYFVDYLVASVLGLSFVVPTSSNFATSGPSETRVTTAQVAEQATLFGGIGEALVRRVIRVDVLDSLEQITFESENPNRQRVWSFRQLASWLL